MQECNEIAFTPEEVENGLFNDFMKFICLYNKKSTSQIESRITSDGYCTIVQWTYIYSDGSGDRFELVNEDQAVMTLIKLPDDSVLYAHKGDEAACAEDWIKEHSESDKNVYYFNVIRSEIERKIEWED